MFSSRFRLNVGSSEAIAETFFRVMTNHRKDEGQSKTNLTARAIVDYYLPHPSQIPRTVANIAKRYLNDRTTQHRIPVFYDNKFRANDKYFISKVLDRKMCKDKKYQFLSDLFIINP